MAQGELHLLFPQWQGSGARGAEQLYHGAWQLHGLLSELEFAGVAVDPERRSPQEEGVLARSDLLSHLRQAQTLIGGAQPERILTLGGDCSVDAAPAAYLATQHRDKLAVVWLDAHADLNTPESSPSGAFHGMVLRTLLGEGDAEVLALLPGRLEPDQVFLAGVRRFDPPELAYFEEMRVRHVSVQDLETHPERLIDMMAARGFEQLHLHLDLDVLDPEVFGAVAYPEPNGLTLQGLARLLQALSAAFEVVGFTLTEYLPQQDEPEAEARLLRELLKHVPLLEPGVTKGQV